MQSPLHFPPPLHQLTLDIGKEFCVLGENWWTTQGHYLFEAIVINVILNLVIDFLSLKVIHMSKLSLLLKFLHGSIYPLFWLHYYPLHKPETVPLCPWYLVRVSVSSTSLLIFFYVLTKMKTISLRSHSCLRTLFGIILLKCRCCWCSLC